MRAPLSSLAMVLAVALSAVSVAEAQYVPPGATLPGGGVQPGPGYRPPGAVQPDTGMITPGPGFRPPGAPYPMLPLPPPTAPRAVTVGPAPAPRAQPLPRNFPSASPPPAARQAARKRTGGRPFTPAKNLEECLGRWSPKEKISRSEWEATCRRLERSGRPSGR
jgi:hypothetical protein